MRTNTLTASRGVLSLALALASLFAMPRSARAQFEEEPRHTSVPSPRDALSDAIKDLAARISFLVNAINYNFAANGREAREELEADAAALDMLEQMQQDEQLASHQHIAPYQDGVNNNAGNDPSAYYLLGNQAPFSVPLGPTSLLFAGARAGLAVGVSTSDFHAYAYQLLAFSGWLPDMHVDLQSGIISPLSDSRALLKGDLYADVQPVGPASCTSQTYCPDSSNCPPTETDYFCDGYYNYRIRYVDEQGAMHVFTARPTEAPILSRYSGAPDPLPTEWWSQDGQLSLDTSNACLPVLRHPDGSVEEFHFPTSGLVPPSPGFFHPLLSSPFNAVVYFDADWNQAFTGNSACDPSAPLRRIDRNGNVTTFSFPDANTRVMRDPRGRTVILRFAPGTPQTYGSPLLTSVTIDGPSRVPETYTVNWEPITFVPGSTGSVFTDIVLGCGSGVTLCGIGAPQTVYVVQSIGLPDGRSYAFQYGPWGNLTRVVKPEGAVFTFQYGGTSAPAPYAASVVALLNSPTVFSGCRISGTAWVPSLINLQEYGLISETIYPQGDGPGQPGFTSTTNYSKVDLGNCTPDPAGAATTGPQCCVQVWRTKTGPDGSQHRDGLCAVSAYYAGTDSVVPRGWPLGEETWSQSASSPMTASYQGTPANGQLSYVYELGPLANPGQCNPSNEVMALDRRASFTRHFKDSVATSQTFSYGDIINIGGTTTRNTANVTAECIWAGAATSCSSGTGTRLVETDTTFQHDANYNARNLLRLMNGTKVLDGGGNVVALHAFTFDGFALGASGQPGLDATYTNAYRGNLTTSTLYKTPASAGSPVATTTYYFDNGAVEKTQSPVDLAAGRFSTSATAFNFNRCYQAPAPAALFYGTGSGASASCSLAGGAVGGCAVTSGGSGYTAAPVVVLVDGSGSGAAATAQLTPTTVASVPYTFDGVEFTTLPSVSFLGGGGSGASATVTMEVEGVAVSSQGSFTSAPSCALSGGGGTGATCSCRLGGSILFCGVVNKGAGYTSQPAVTFSGGGASASGYALLGVNKITMTAAGSGYTSPPTAAMIGMEQSVVAQTRATAVLTPTSVASVTITIGGGGYASAPASNLTLAETTANALGHTTTTVDDCYSGIRLSSVDPNGQRTCTQYDGLSRAVETAAPGDALSAEPACTSASAPASCYVRDAACSASGATVGNGGHGPTTWTEYFPFGLNGVGYNQARTVVHTKDGSALGKYTKAFVDGMGRAIESCTRIDPATGAGAAGDDEVCTYSSYDNMGRLFQGYAPFYAADVASAAQPSGGQYTQHCYDALDREVGSALIWAGSWSCGGAPPSTSLTTTTAYGSANGAWITTVTNPNGNQSQTLTDALGHVIEIDQFQCAASPCTTSSGVKLATTTSYDVLGRMLSTTDAAGNVLSIGYDGLGRKISMHDPDMGDWSYGYDDNGNLISQTDAKQQTIAMQYDALNRITLKDLPPAGPDVWDVRYFYDGNRAFDCYSCFDPASGATGACNTVTTTCVGVDGESGRDCTPGATQGCDNPVCDESCGSGSCTGATQTCNAAGTGWSACTGGTCPPPPPPPACTPGATQGCDNPVCDESCGGGSCTGATQTCNAAGTGWSACSGGTCPPPPPCTPGTTRGCDNPTCDESCSSGSCAGATQTCGSAGSWGACSGGTCLCTVGAQRTVACGNCGTELDTCGSNGQWIAGACGGQGVCAAGATRTLACGNCGSETDTCAANCQWAAGACGGQGVCAPNATRSENCNDAAGDAGTETDTCGASCQWSNGGCFVCSPGATRSCDSGICASCANGCVLGSQTCSASHLWGSCTGGHCTIGGGGGGGCRPPMICN